MRPPTLIVAFFAAWFALPAIARAQAIPPQPAADAPAQPNNYADDKTWLCRPGRQDACAVDLATTIVAADGRLTREAWNADANASIDCFYVYPTVSTDPGVNSDMTADPAELNVVRQQFARFGSKCRLFAPLYRQVTLAGLRRQMTGGGRVALDRGLAYDDVRDAWRYYLEHDNRGRGFVLIGHSQGSFILTELIRQEIDGKPIQSRMVSAILPGTTIAVPKGKDVGGVHESRRACRRQRPVARLPFKTRPDDRRQPRGSEAVGDAGPTDRDAVGERAWTAHCPVRDQRERDLPRSDGTRGPG